MAQPWRENRQELAVLDSATEQIPMLVRALVEQASNGDAAADRSQSDNAEEIILDLEIDGTRYLLIRSCIRPSGLQMRLSPRELEIARMVAQGYPNKTIAAVLEISSWTVGTHLRRIFAKLGVSTRAAMVARLLNDSVLGNPAKISELGPGYDR